mgnify:CR=1 FL=1
MIKRLLMWLAQDAIPPYLHEPSGSHCGLCGRWVEGDPGDKSYPWDWRWTMCPECAAVGEMSDEEFRQYLIGGEWR